MADKYSIKNVTDDLAFLLTLTGIFEVDDKKFWQVEGDNARYVYKLDDNDKGHEIVLFQDPLPKGDVYYFNPFSEGFGKKSPATQLYNRTIRIRLNLNIRTVVLWLVEKVIEHKATEGEKPSLPHAVLRMTSGMVNKNQTFYDVVDETMRAEFRKIFDRLDDNVVQVPYLINQMTAKVTCDALTDPAWDEKFGKDIRKKSMAAFKIALMGVLGISSADDLSQFTVKYDPDLKTVGSFYTAMSVYLKLYTRFNDVLAEAYAVEGKPQPGNEINLGELSEVIDRFPMAYTIAKHMQQPVLPSVPATSTSTADTSQLSIAKTGGNRFAPETVDLYGRASRTPIMAPVIRTGGRFAPEVVQERTDPFAPPVIAAAPMTMNTGSYFSNSGMPGFNQPSYGFGQSSGMGLDLRMPNNFGSPSTRW